MNIFYAPPSQISGNRIELLDQEARHARKVMRYREGDSITVVDGVGGWYEGTILRLLRDSVLIELEEYTKRKKPRPERVMAFGMIKKRDRLEFAVEKAVELGASEIVLFRSEHTVKQNVRMDRLESTALSAMKQSLRAHLPAVKVINSLEETLQQYNGYKTLVAHEKQKAEANHISKYRDENDKLLLLVGPEGGFSENEITITREKGADIISLGPNRLRAETAVVAFLSQFINLK